MSDNPAFVLRSKENVLFEQKPIREISDHEILVEVKKTGICGSDVHFYSHGEMGRFVVNHPMVLGHESSGIVHRVGAKVSHLKVGDRVALEPGAACNLCDLCKSGRYQLCPHMEFAATPPHDGTLVRYYPLPGDVAYKLPEGLSFEDGAMIEPLAVAVHAVANLASFRTNQTIAVWGAGPVGLLCMATAKALGASRIVAVDIVPSRLEFAKSYVGAQTFLPPAPLQGETKADYSKRTAERMREELCIESYGPKSIDVVVDASGADASIQTAIFIVKVGGTYIQLGFGKSDVEIPITLLLVKELTFKGSFRYGSGDYPLAIALVSQGKVDLKPLVTHRYPFTDAANAFKATKAGKSEDGVGVIKAIISGPDVSPMDI